MDYRSGGLNRLRGVAPGGDSPEHSMDAHANNPLRALLRFDAGSSRRNAQPGHGRRAEEGVISNGRAIRTHPTPLLDEMRERPPIEMMARAFAVRRRWRHDVTEEESHNKSSVEAILFEIQQMQTNPMPGIYSSPKGDNMYEWCSIVEGGKGTPYEGGTFIFDLYIPRNYPAAPPKIIFLTKVLHPYVGEQGVLDYLSCSVGWRTYGDFTIRAVLSFMTHILSQFPPDNLYTVFPNWEDQKMPFYWRSAQQITRLYAM